ncbi:hypothetical protein MN116_004112 [Schistosoma mekongi]|uniref:Ion transport domain-containing protein n=1 Tax=Schistosoma mekongi TaxID=38744 RepID=A0AAE1ZFI2_SCHME|nr:hypothetical protein MN116_004112 [Schistosoma mekongi]
MSTESNNLTTSEGKRLMAAKIAGAVSSGGSPARVINAFIQVQDYQGLDRYLSKHKVPNDILTASLQSACMRSDSEAVGTFAKHGANVNHADQFGTTLLHFAMRGGGDENVIKALVAHGLEYHTWRSEGMPLLHWACSTGLINLVEYLVEHGTASLQEADENGRLPIHVAAVFGQPVILSYLIRVLSTRLHPVSVPAQFLSALNEDHECSADDDEAEVNANHKQTENTRHLKISVTSKDCQASFKASIMKTVAAANYLDMNHWTPLHHASCEDAVNYYYDCIKILLDNGADPMLPTSQGKTALDLAYAAGRSQMLVDVLPKKQLIALLMLIDDIVPLKVRKRLIEEEKQKERSGVGNMIACEQYNAMSAKRERSPALNMEMNNRYRKGYSFIRRIADKMDTSDVSKGQLGNFGKSYKVDSTNIMSIWRKILLNDNVELLETLRDSLAWRQNKSNTSTLATDFSKITEGLTIPTEQISLDDFESAQQISLKQMSELFSDCYENGTGVFTHVQGAFQENLKAHDFRTVLQSMTGLLTFKSLSTNKIVILHPMHRSLLFLAIICGRFRVVEQLLRMRQFDVLPAAVLVTLILRRLHKEPGFPQQMLGELSNFADRLEAIAVDVLNLVFLKDNTPEKMICRSMLNVRLRTFGGISLIDLCAKAKCTNVLSLSCCQRLLDERWHGVLICLPTWMRWTCKFIPVAGIFYFEYRTKKELKRAELIRNITASAGGKLPCNLLNDSVSHTDGKSTGNIITKVFPATPQLPSNQLVLKRPKTLKAQNTTPVHSSQSPTPHVSIYERMSNQFGWTSSPRWHFVTGVYSSPSMKFCLHSLFHLLFLVLFSIVCVYNLHFSFSRMELVSLSYVLGYAFEELRQLILEASRDGFSDYFRDGWNWIDVFAISLTFVGFCTRMNVVNKHSSEFEEAHDVVLYSTRNLYMLGLNLFYMRTLYITSISPIIGPRLKMMADMLRKDLIPLLLVFAIFIFSYGVWFQGLIYPNSFYETQEQRQKRHLMNNSELSRQRDMQRLGVLTSFSELFRRAFYSIFEVSIVLEEETCEGNRYCGSELGFNTVIFFVLVLYVGIVNIILINLLIALFSNTVSRIDQKSTAHWLAGRYKMVKEYSERTLLPPPLNTLCIMYELFRCFYIGTSQCFCRDIKFPFGRNKTIFKTESNDETDAQENDSPDEENSNLKKNLTRENQLIKIKEENNRRIKLLMGESDDRGKSYKQEIDAVLKFILIQSFALQNSRQTLGSGISFRGPYTNQNTSNSDGTINSENIQIRNNQIDSRLERIEAILERVVDRVNQIKLTDMSPQMTPSIRSPVPIRMPSIQLTHAPSDLQFTRIPTSKELLQQLSGESQNESETNTHMLSSKLTPIKIQKSL